MAVAPSVGGSTEQDDAFCITCVGVCVPGGVPDCCLGVAGSTLVGVANVFCDSEDTLGPTVWRLIDMRGLMVCLKDGGPLFCTGMGFPMAELGVDWRGTGVGFPTAELSNPKDCRWVINVRDRVDNGGVGLEIIAGSTLTVQAWSTKGSAATACAATAATAAEAQLCKSAIVTMDAC